MTDNTAPRVSRDDAFTYDTLAFNIKTSGYCFQALKLMTKENSLNSNLMKKPLCISALKNKQKYMVQV